MTECTTRAFGGCSCTGKCQAYSTRLDEINRKIATVQAKRRADRALLTFIACLAIGTAGAMAWSALVDLDRQIQIAERV